MTTAATLRDEYLRKCPTELARMRSRYNLTVRDVAGAVGIGYGTLSVYENGWSVPAVAIRERLATFYEVEVDALFPRSRRAA